MSDDELLRVLHEWWASHPHVMGGDVQSLKPLLRSVYASGIESAIKVCDSVNGDPTVGPYTGAEHCAKRIRRALLPDVG